MFNFTSIRIIDVFLPQTPYSHIVIAITLSDMDLSCDWTVNYPLTSYHNLCIKSTKKDSNQLAIPFFYIIIGTIITALKASASINIIPNPPKIPICLSTL